jgi:hypothetical protein
VSLRLLLAPKQWLELTQGTVEASAASEAVVALVTGAH